MNLTHLLFIALPISITFWSINVLNSSKEISQLSSPLRWLLSVSVPIGITLIAYHKKSLNLSGCVFALITGFVLTISNFCFCTSLLMFFISSSLATNFKKNRKRLIEDNFEESAQRNWIQVICNGGVATHLALFYIMENGPGEIGIDFMSNYNKSWWCISVLGSICCANGDTWASELGSVLGSSDPFLITSPFRRVPRGTNGGVSFIGLVVSALGGLSVSFAYVLTEWLCVSTYHWYSSPPQFFPILLMGIISGLLGSIIDSLMGATLQYSGLKTRKVSNLVPTRISKVVEYPGPGIRYISGRAFLDNHSVNLLSNLITAIISPLIAIHLWTYF